MFPDQAQSRSTPDSAGLWASSRNRPWAGALIVLVLVLHAGLTGATARYCTVTHDEYWHVPVGLLNLTTGRFDYDDLNPPLIRMWSAVPLTVAGAKAGPAEQAENLTDYGDRFLAANRDRYQHLLFVSRLAIVLLSVLFCFVVAQWTSEMFGLRAGLVALGLTAFSPSVIANGALVTTDLAAALAFVVCCRFAATLAASSSLRSAILLGVCLGAAQLTKYTCVLLYGLTPVVWFIFRRRNSGSGARAGLTKSAGQWAVALTVSLVVLDAGYLFRGVGKPLREYPFQSSAMKQLRDRSAVLANVPLPVPYDYVTGIDHQRHAMEGKHPVFLDGIWSESGFRSYYLKVLWYKLPHATQLLLLLAFWRFVRRRQRDTQRERIALLVPAIAVVVIASLSKMQLGIRYILPALPFLWMLAAEAGAGLWESGGRLRRVVFVILLAGMVVPLRFHPHHIAHFNELAGGPEAGWHSLIDSNIDWGQDLNSLKAWLDEHPANDLRLAYFGTFPPHELGLNYQMPSSGMPEPGWYALSLNFLQGRPNPIRTIDGTTQVGLDAFGYMRFFEPVERIGCSIRVYHLTEADIIDWKAARRRLRNRL